MMRNFNHLDRALRHLREGRRTRQYQIAEAAGITKAMLSAYETGKQKPSLETLDKILGALGCDLIDLHKALAVFREDPPRGGPRENDVPAARRDRSVQLAARPSRDSRRAAEASASADVYSALGIDQPLERDEEKALGEVLTSFHKLIRHIHGRLHDRGPDSVGASESGDLPREDRPPREDRERRSGRGAHHDR